VNSRTVRSFKQSTSEFFAEQPLEKAAALSYYALLALAPLVLIVLAVAGLAFGREAVEGQVVSEIRHLVGEQGAEAVQLILQNAEFPGKNAASLVIGLLTLLVGASGVFLQLQAALNSIWDVEPRPKGNAIWNFLRHRLVSMAMVLGLGFLMLVSLVVSAGLSAINSHFSSVIAWPVVWQAVNHLGSLLIITLLIAMIYRFLPDTRIPWRAVWVGAFVTAVLFTLGKAAIGAYLGNASIGSSYGAAGSIVVLVVWVYYASLIFFVGAEVTHAYARKRGHMQTEPRAAAALG
jgi:membrane protein